MACLRNLSNEYVPDLPPHVDIDQLSGPEIKNVVVRAVRAYDSWNKEYPEANREAVLKVKNPEREMDPRQVLIIDILLVPGGEYVMVRWFRGALQCYHVPTGECVWNLPPRPAGEEIPELKPQVFSADLIATEGSKQLMVLVAFVSIYSYAQSVFFCSSSGVLSYLLYQQRHGAIQDRCSAQTIDYNNTKDSWKVRVLGCPHSRGHSTGYISQEYISRQLEEGAVCRSN